MSLYSQTYKQLPLITAPEIHTDLLWDLSFLFIGLAAVYFVFVFFYRNRLSKQSWQVKERKKELAPMISEFLFHEEDASKDEKSHYVKLKIEIRQLIKDDFNRKVLSEVLLDLRKDVAGVTQIRLFKLYQDLGFHNEDFRKLKSWRWEIVSKAILNLTQMQVAEAYSFLTKFINDKRHTIRKQAEIAVVTLKPEGINYFLDTTKFKISEWQQLKLMDVLRNDDDYQAPRFKAWLTSTNRHVVLFALRLIKYYNQNDADAALIELVKHKNSQIKEEAIGCIKEFHIVEALPTLKLVFWKSSTDVKISILNAIGVLGDPSDIEFLQLIEKKEANFSVRSKAHASINAIAPDSIMPSKGLINAAKYTIPADIEIKEEEEEEDFAIELHASLANENESLEASEAIEMAEVEVEVEVEVEKNITDVSAKDVQEINELAEQTIDNDVKPDVMEENQESEQKETTKPIANEVSSEENETLSFDFLPLVIQEVIDTDANISKEEEGSGIELNAIVVNFDEVTSKEKVKPQRKKTPSLKIKEEEIAFLPIVTDEIKEQSKDNSTEDQLNTASSLDEIDVQFERVVPIIQMDVQFEEVEYTSVNQELEFPLEYSIYKTVEILDADVIYDEITASSIENIESENISQTDPYFLSSSVESPQEDTMDEMSNVNPQPLQTYNEMEPQDEQKFKKIIQDLINFNEQNRTNETKEEFQNGPLLDFGDEFVQSGNIVEFEDNLTEEEKDSKTEFEDTLLEKHVEAELTIPKSILTDNIYDDFIPYEENTEESRMQLLDDLAEMGDKREIPLLNELLVNAKYKTIIERVEGLIARFSEPGTKSEPDSLLKPFNVFEDLFRTCDIEAKLILMDEIVAVGDEAEIGFLEGLLKDEETEICNKAARILEELRLKLSNSKEENFSDTPLMDFDQKEVSNMEVLIEEETLAEYDSLMEELQIAPPQASEIFDFNFELSEPLPLVVEKSTMEKKPVEKKGKQVSFLGQICAFSNKIIERLNG